MRNPKYIIFDDNDGHGNETPIIFPNKVTHSDMAKAMAEIGYARPVSAGFVRVTAKGNFICSGKSESMGLSSRPDDGGVLDCYLESWLER